MVDLSTNYLGFQLKNPLVASASPLSKKVENIKRLADAGIGAVVIYSLFEEQIVHESKALEHFLRYGSESFAEAMTYFPPLKDYNVEPREYLDLISKAKKTVNVPIIGSLNGFTSGGWIEYAKKIEQAGADALELNIYNLPTQFEATAQELEDAHVELVSNIKKQINIPLAVKLGPYFTALPGFTRRLTKAGANGLVLFNRFMQPDLDIETLEVNPKVELSTSSELRLPLRWIAILYGQIKADLALTTGIHTAQDVVKALMAGANVAMMASELIAKGPERVKTLLVELEDWMKKFDYESVSQMRGSMSQKNVKEPAAFERANYMKALQSFDDKLPA